VQGKVGGGAKATAGELRGPGTRAKAATGRVRGPGSKTGKTEAGQLRRTTYAAMGPLQCQLDRRSRSTGFGSRSWWDPRQDRNQCRPDRNRSSTSPGRSCHPWRTFTPSGSGRKPSGLQKTPITPATNCSVCCRLAGGTAASGLKPPDSGTVSSHRP